MSKLCNCEKGVVCSLEGSNEGAILKSTMRAEYKLGTEQLNGPLRNKITHQVGRHFPKGYDVLEKVLPQDRKLQTSKTELIN